MNKKKFFWAVLKNINTNIDLVVPVIAEKIKYKRKWKVQVLERNNGAENINLLENINKAEDAPTEYVKIDFLDQYELDENQLYESIFDAFIELHTRNLAAYRNILGDSYGI